MGHGRPKAIVEVPDSELIAALELCFARRRGIRQPIASLDRRALATASSFAIEDLDLRFIDGAGSRIAFKSLGKSTMLDSAGSVKPDFLFDPLREIKVYEAILQPLQLGTAACYGSIINAETDRYWLFLEWIDGVELYQIGDFSIWQEAARWLATLHSRYNPDIQAPHLLRYDAAFFGVWAARAETFLKGTEMWRFISSLAQRYDRVVEQLMALPATLIHGEAYASNILVAETGGRLRICPVDWEMAGVGPRFLDIAALTVGKWNDEQRRAIALSYRAAMLEQGSCTLSEDEFFEAVEYCRLHLCVQWLGWAAGWNPPPHHAHNWFKEAVVLVERLGI